MALSPTVQHELTAELVHLERERERLDQRIAAIRLLTGVAPRHVAQLVFPDSATFGAQAMAAAVETLGLRSVIRHILRDGPKAPAEVIAAVKAQGYKHEGKTPLETRIYNELGRLKKEDEAGRDSEGRYYIA